MPQLSKKCAETPAENKNQWLEMLRFSEVCYEFGCLSTSYLTRNVALFFRRTRGQRAFFVPEDALPGRRQKFFCTLWCLQQAHAVVYKFDGRDWSSRIWS